MEPRIESLPSAKFIGMHLRMSLRDNQTKGLWQSFMPRRPEITNPIGAALYSIEIYDSTSYFDQFNPSTPFEKWAAVRVRDFDKVPAEMDTLEMPEGLYAVFLYKGKPSAVATVFQYIFGTWLPNSDFELDDRPHFAKMGARYKGEDPDSEEELWIPVTPGS